MFQWLKNFIIKVRRSRRSGFKLTKLDVIIRAMAPKKWRHIVQVTEKGIDRFYVNGCKLPSKAIRRLMASRTVECWGRGR